MIGRISFRHNSAPILPDVAGRMFKLNGFSHGKWAHWDEMNADKDRAKESK